MKPWQRHPDVQTCAQLLRERRVDKGLTQLALGLRLSTDTSQISRIESGDRVLEPDEVTHYLRGLGVLGTAQEPPLRRACIAAWDAYKPFKLRKRGRPPKEDHFPPLRLLAVHSANGRLSDDEVRDIYAARRGAQGTRNDATDTVTEPQTSRFFPQIEVLHTEIHHEEPSLVEEVRDLITLAQPWVDLPCAQPANPADTPCPPTSLPERPHLIPDRLLGVVVILALPPRPWRPYRPGRRLLAAAAILLLGPAQAADLLVPCSPLIVYRPDRS